MNDLKATFKDIMRFRTPMDIPESQLGRAVQFKSELQKILHAATGAADVIEGKAAQVKRNAGRREEEMFWIQILKKSEKMVREVLEITEKYDSIEVSGSRQEKAATRRKQKNAKKGEERKLKAVQKVEESGRKKKPKPTSAATNMQCSRHSQPSILSMFNPISTCIKSEASRPHYIPPIPCTSWKYM